MNTHLQWEAARQTKPHSLAFVVVCVLLLLRLAPACAQTSTLLYYEGFENGWNGWTNDTTFSVDLRFAWVIGSPTNGPGAAHTGTNCAATLDPGTDCYLVSPPLALPLVNQYSNHLWLFYWQWQKYNSSSVCLSDVKIREYQGSPAGGYWGPWNVIDPGSAGPIQRSSPAWRRRGMDLTLFSGGIIELGFGHGGVGDPGWFVDDVEVRDVPVMPDWPGAESFENGWGAWHTEDGAWDIGIPAGGGPTNCPNGLRCAGTGLDGSPSAVYQAYLWTPAFYMPALNPGERAYLQFEIWYDYPSPFCTSLHWSQWWTSIGWSWPQSIDSELLVVASQRQWSTVTKDITVLVAPGQILPLRLGFGHGNYSTNGLGAFIDNVRIKVAHLRLTDIRRQGNHVQLAWTAPAGTTNVLQCSRSLAATFTNASPPLIATGTAEATTAFTHTNAVSASPLFYRVRRLP